ncbi:MAG: PQQ-dependent dehydrogenase, methanol/ethanol family [Pseudomonadales bacterium]|nr:PQQ-dependent dehydrogenase, methanol/ethanol family [Pseudomonadales bacterium]
MTAATFRYLLISCAFLGSSALAAAIDQNRLNGADSEPGSWLTHGRTYSETRESPLSQINPDNVSRLGLSWYFDTSTRRGLEASPLVIDGVLFTTGAWSTVFALNAKTGALIWSYDPRVPRAWGVNACCDVVNRGVAAWGDLIFVGALDGRLIALDRATGAVRWETLTIDPTRPYTITGAPRVVKGKVVIGNGGAEYGVRGYVSAYDAETGALDWRFHTVPGNPAEPFESDTMRMAAATWSGDLYWQVGGGGTVWDSMAYDPELDLLYIGVGNGAPWNRHIRSPGGGDNLFLSSIVALDPDTGDYVWHYQTTPGDTWDYTATQHMILADLPLHGQTRKVLMQAPKNGFFYVLDRSTGELLRANPFATVTWASHVDLETGRPVENPDLDYTRREKWVLPGPLGAHNWQAMSVDVEAGVVYLPAQDNPLIYGMSEQWQQTGLYKRNPGGWNTGLEFGAIAQLFVDNLDDQPTPKGYLKAFDPLTGEDKWVVEIPHYWNGGVLGTAGGLVFQGDALGYLTAYDKASGEVLWQFNTYTSMLAPPITFEIDGTQYLAILTGSGGGDLFAGEAMDPVKTAASTTYGNQGRMLVFKLGGAAELPIPTAVDRTIPEQQPVNASDEEIARGERLYNTYCTFCHGLIVRSGGSIPDLRRMSEGSHEAFNQIVLEGLLARNGMASFADVMAVEDSESVHLYVRARAHEDREVALGNKEEARLTWLN